MRHSFVSQSDQCLNDAQVIWRIIYRLDADTIIIGEVFSKKTGKTPYKVIDICKRRFRDYDDA